VAAFLVMIYTITPVFVLQTIWAPLDILPLGFSLWDSLGTIFGVALPAFLVMGALHGRAGIRDLASRSTRWRVSARWYFIALFGLPAGLILFASIIYGLVPLVALMDKSSLLFSLILPDFFIRLILFNLPEEIGFMGFLQARLQDQYGPLKAVVLVEIPFALWHVPDLIVQTEGQLSLLLLLFGLFSIGQLFGRVVIQWLYNNTNRSVLLVSLFHAAHNTTISRFVDHYIPGTPLTWFLLTEGVVMLAAILLIIFTRGRLSYKPDHISQIVETPLVEA
jgi:membrane protease YdiL (CAAX protease family)